MRRFFYDTEFMEAPGFLELLSIGVVSEDGQREFYAENEEADLARANPWVRENVLPHLNAPGVLRLRREGLRRHLRAFLNPQAEDPVELWGYYSAYDHVALCWLFGSMVDLPPGMPMLTLDVQQLALARPTRKLPPQVGVQHNALADARWTRDAWLFLMTDGTRNRVA
jgi:hypothetical protein